ncbi:MAG: MraY family glycosyltransferase [Fimbriimonadaceae bacterium]
MMPFWLGLALSSILAYPIFCILIKLNSRQKVSEYAPESHQAKQGTPTMGGLIFVIPVVLAGLWMWLQLPPRPTVFYTSSLPSPEHAYREGSWLAIVFLFLSFALIGFVDDFVVPRLLPAKRGLGWRQKLGLQLIVAIAYTVATNRGTYLPRTVEVIAILACANAYNFADGLDGLASSIGLLLVPGLIVLGGKPEFPLFLELLAGAMLPFAFLNAPKAKVFMGDVGSLAFGSAIGAAVAGPLFAIPSQPVTFGLGVVVLLLVLIAELFPVPLQIFWVKVFKRRLFPFTPIHHAFEKAGWQETRVVALFAFAQLVCTLGCISLVRTGLYQA